ncbi:MAG TPA: reverse transcriptase-like protein [Candidatus Paceibacterota bacterium]
MKFLIQADGGARGNPGPAGSGAVVRDASGKTLIEVAHFLGHATNNVAEYTALVLALEGLAAMLGPDEVKETQVAVEMDSKLVIEQMKGAWKIKHPNMKPLAARAAELCRQFASVSFTHIPRERNGAADALANLAMDRGA